MDVDGVLTNGSLLVNDAGEQWRTMNISDGYALQLAAKKDLKLAVISGGNSSGVVQRLKGLGISDVLINVPDKKSALISWARNNHADLPTTIYIGDDIPDLPAMQMCGVPCCPEDAAPEIQAVSVYISPLKGGKGCVREILEKVLKLQNKWME